jgi:hypothetical protein
MSSARGERRHSSLREHRRHRKTLTPPLMALGNVQANPDWRKKRVPDMLWLSAMVDVHAGDWQAAHRALDALDPFVPASETFWMDGRLTTFSLVPPAARAAARRALVEAAPESLVPELGQALSFFPNSPGAWLFEDWAFEVDHDPDVGLAYLRERMAELEYSRAKHSVQVRMVALGRSFHHRKIFLPANLDVIPLLGRYPNLEPGEAGRVEQFSRMTYDMQAGHADEERFGALRDRWCRTFWQECARLARRERSTTGDIA